MLQQASARRARYRWLADATNPLAAAVASTTTRPMLANSLFRAIVGGMTVLAIMRLEIREPPAVVLAALAAGGWLCLASLFDAAAMVLMWLASRDLQNPSIPLRFAGSTGRFMLRRWERSRVEVTAGSAVVAELVTNPRGDELVVYDVASISAAELPDLGSAIGQAMEIMATDAQSEGDAYPPFE